MKNVVVCCDGTANEFAANKTNVVKLYSVLEPSERQVAFYHPGLGTMEPPGALSDTGRSVRRLLGKAIGWGLEQDICDAYTYVMNNFQHGDRLYLFGFSRGAYVVRALASLLRMYGLLPVGNVALVPYAVRLLTGVNKGNSIDGAAFHLAREFKGTFTTLPCPIHFVGVWDTVSSVGWISNRLRLPYTADNSEIMHGRHAIAIDERRAFFRTNLWRPQNTATGGPKDLKQVWFAGVHCDVGGYTEVESGLSKLSLQWMVNEAVACDLAVDSSKVRMILGDNSTFATLDPNAKMHNSIGWLWLLAEIIPKKTYGEAKSRWRLNLGRRRFIPSGAMIHWSIYERQSYEPWLPAEAVKVERDEPREDPSG